MKVRIDTPDLLVIESRPVVAAALIAVIAFAFVAAGLFTLPNDALRGVVLLAIGVVAGGYFLWGTARRETLTLNRGGGWGEIRRRTLTARQVRRFSLDDLASARLDTYDMAEGSTTARVMLRIGEREEPLTQVRSTLPGQKQAAERINAWLGLRP